MSENDNAVSTEASLDEIHGVGPARMEKLPSDSVGELADSSAQVVFNRTDDMSATEVENIVETAREAIDYTPVEANVYTKSEDEQEDDSTGSDDESGAEIVEEEFSLNNSRTIDQVAAQPEDCDTIAVMAGDGAFGADGLYCDLTDDRRAEKVAQHVAKKLVDQGFDGADKIIVPGSGMGRVAFNSWYSYTKNQTDESLPEVKVISVQTEDGEYPTGEDYRERNHKILDEVDGISMVANGDYVGMWVNMVNERDDVIIRTPSQDE